MQLLLKKLSGMANSVDPDQIIPSGAVWSGSALFAYAILLETRSTKFQDIYCRQNWCSCLFTLVKKVWGLKNFYQ